MQKKRFMRLIMAHGIQRNEAAAIARRVAIYGSYAALYESLRPWLAFRSLRAATIHAAAGLVALGKSLRNAFYDAVSGFCVGVDLSNGEDTTVFHHTTKNRNDAVDALAYSVKYMSKEEHAAAHKLDGYRPRTVIFDEREGSGNDE